MGLLDKIKSLGNSSSPSFTPPAAPLANSKKRILIVEDDEALRTLYQDILTAENFEVVTAANGQLGLDSIMAKKPDLVLLDIMMPVMDGKTMLRTVRNNPDIANLPVIVLTNAGDLDTMRETKFYGKANSFLIKSSVTPQDVVNTIKTFT